MQNLFFLSLQHYIWQKKGSGYWNEKDCPFPSDVDYMIMDTFESLRPKTKLFTSLEEAQNAVAELNKEYEDKISKIYLCQSNIYVRAFYRNTVNGF